MTATENSPFLKREGTPDDVLDAVKTFPRATAYYCDWLSTKWTSSASYLGWAKEHLTICDLSHDLSAFVFAKRAVCRQIDALIRFNHLRAFLNKKYPAKIQALASIGIGAPEIVYDLVIGPRNSHEHDYTPVDHQRAKHAVEIADLFLSKSAADADFGGPVAVMSHSIGGYSGDCETGTYEFRGFRDALIVLVDIFENEDAAQVRVLDAVHSEVRSAALNDFNERQILELNRLIRAIAKSNRTGGDPRFYFAFKKYFGL